MTEQIKALITEFKIVKYQHFLLTDVVSEDISISDTNRVKVTQIYKIYIHIDTYFILPGRIAAVSDIYIVLVYFKDQTARSNFINIQKKVQQKDNA